MEKDNSCIYDFSIVILCYNPMLDKLKKTIISSVKQKNVTFEIIISDDGSLNDYYTELKSWILVNFDINIFKFNFLEKNVGTISNYFSAVRLSSGRYIKPISPGDYFYNELSLQTYKNAFLNDYVLVYSDCTYYNEQGILDKKQYPISRSIFNKKINKKTYCIYREYFVGATICVEKNHIFNILEKVNGKIIYSEDLITMLISFMGNYNVNCVEKNLIFYEFGNGISTGKKINNFLVIDNQKAYNYVYNHFSDNQMVKRMKKRNSISKYPFFIKLFLMLLLFPDVLAHKLLNAFNRPKKYNELIEDLTAITSIGI